VKNHIFIIGFMGAGKTTLAKELAEKKKIRCLDTDEEIERLEGKSISSIFKEKGEYYFRTLETNLILSLSNTPHVISCGGGLPCYNDNILKLKKIGKVVFLNTDVEIIFSRLREDKSRPLLLGKSDAELKNYIDETIQSRSKYYLMADKVWID